jgi:hypothetical protein
MYKKREKTHKKTGFPVFVHPHTHTHVRSKREFVNSLLPEEEKQEEMKKTISKTK